MKVAYINMRVIQRNYRVVKKQLEEEKIPIIVMSNNQPQFVIISMEMFESLQNK